LPRSTLQLQSSTDASACAAASAPVQQLKMRLTVGDTIHELLIPFRTGQAFKLEFSVVA
jgi:hypothetical protein